MNILKLAWKSGVQPHKLFPKEFYREILLKEGHVMIKNTGIKSQEDFENWRFLVTDKHTMEYEGEGKNKTTLFYDVLDNGIEPPYEIVVEPHNEFGYHNKMPSRMLFYCLKPSIKGGMTPVGSNRLIQKEMPDRLMNKFKEHGQILITNYFSEPHIGKEKAPFKSWQSTFNVKSKEEFEEKLKTQEGFIWKWGTYDRLTLLRKTSGFLNHPITGEECWTNIVPDVGNYWFNDWEPWKHLDLEEKPFHTIWGNGDRFTPEESHELYTLINKHLKTEPFELGDILLVDNLLAMHGRTSQEGENIIPIVMGDPIFRESTNYDMTGLDSFLDNWKYLKTE